MSKRAVILWACLLPLALSAAQVTAVFEPQEAPSSHQLSTESEQVNDLSSTPSSDFELLRAVYSPDEGEEIQLAEGPIEIDEATLWLARAIYSETKLPHEQELVAWVVRNRVETNFRGKSSYKEVVLDPYQFSAFNPDAPKRSFLLNLTPDTQLSEWQQALWIAHYVRQADSAYRPFSRETRHFFSERSMKNHSFPYWAETNPSHSVSPDQNLTVEERRFRFYKEIS